MNLISILVLLGLAVWVVLAVRSAKKHKCGGCDGDCEHCEKHK